MNNPNEIGPLKGVAIFLVIAAFIMTPLIIITNHDTKLGEAAARTFFDPGLAAYQQGHYADAEADLKQFLDVDPGSAETKYDLGLCTLAQGKRADARFWFRAAEVDWRLENEGKHRSYCGDQLCHSTAIEMLAWMDNNPMWIASQTTPMPPLLKAL